MKYLAIALVLITLGGLLVYRDKRRQRAIREAFIKDTMLENDIELQRWLPYKEKK